MDAPPTSIVTGFGRRRHVGKKGRRFEARFSTVRDKSSPIEQNLRFSRATLSRRRPNAAHSSTTGKAASAQEPLDFKPGNGEPGARYLRGRKSDGYERNWLNEEGQGPERPRRTAALPIRGAVPSNAPVAHPRSTRFSPKRHSYRRVRGACRLFERLGKIKHALAYLRACRPIRTTERGLSAGWANLPGGPRGSARARSKLCRDAAKSGRCEGL